jgi:hypothetical protein
MFFLHARFPLRLDCEGWEGAPSLDLAGVAATRDVVISAQGDFNFSPVLLSAMGYVICD